MRVFFIDVLTLQPAKENSFSLFTTTGIQRRLAPKKINTKAQRHKGKLLFNIHIKKICFLLLAEASKHQKYALIFLSVLSVSSVVKILVKIQMKILVKILVKIQRELLAIGV